MSKRISLCWTIFAASSLLFGQATSDDKLAARLKANRVLFASFDNGPDLLAQLRTQNQDVSRNLYVNETPMICTDCAKPAPGNNPTVKMATVESDLVVLAKDSRNLSGLTQKRAFVFTDAQMIVEQVWKAEGPYKEPQHVRVGSEITVAVPGGSLTQEGHTISASLSNHIPFQPGNTYLLYLVFNPDSNTYTASRLSGFDVTGPSVIPLRTTSASLLEEYQNDPAAFLDLMKKSTNLALNTEEAK